MNSQRQTAHVTITVILASFTLLMLILRMKEGFGS
jgi:hypothetical protein